MSPDREGRHDDAQLLSDEAFALLLGVKVELWSSWLMAARYDAEAQALTLWTHGGPADGYTWPGVTFEQAQSFAEAGSKGGWVHDNLPLGGR